MLNDTLTIGEIKTAGPVESVAACYERVTEVEPDVRAFVEPPDRDRLLTDAEALGERFESDAPVLYGVPVGVKDIFRTDNFPTRAGSDLPPETFAGPQAEAVTRLRCAGALVMGKTVTTEFAYAAPGPTRNPCDLEHTPGGSSSGSAAAVASGMCPLAIGTQTVGSVIRPAAFCGVVGIKPSFGRIPTDGIVPFSESADHVGVFAGSVSDAGVATKVLCDEWEESDPGGRPTIGVPDGPYLEQAENVGRDRFEVAIDALSAAGYDVRRVPAFDGIRRVNARHREMIAAELAIAHDEWFERYGDRYADVTVEKLQDGHQVTVKSLVDARNGRRRLREHLHRRMDDSSIDIWISPAAPGPAPEGIDSTGDPVMNLPWTHAGLPVVTIPAGTSMGLPVGVQCIGRYGADESLLSWCETLSDVFTAVA